MRGDLVLDIECVSSIQEEDESWPALVEMATNANEPDPLKYGALCAPLARVVSVAMRSGGRDLVIVDGALVDLKESPDPPRRFMVKEVAGEKALLAAVNEIVGHQATKRLVTFNGRSYDLPILLTRSRINRVAAAPLLVEATTEPRFKARLHVDMLEVVTVQGATRRFPMRALAIAMGIDDPKKLGHGGAVADLVRARDGERLVAYNMGDVACLAEALELWEGVA